jgi:hypothetical protein
MPNSNLIEKLRNNTDLGHEKKNKTFIRQVELHTKSPGTSIPKAAGKTKDKVPFADAISMYRFANNEDISLSGLREARAKTVLESLPQGTEITLIHDLTLLDYSKHNSKQDRRVIGNHRGKGYEYATCLAVDTQSETVLGVIHDTVINITGPDDQDMMDYDYEPLFANFAGEERQRLYENHRHQMAVHIAGTSSLLSEFNVVDVGDREFDDIFVLANCLQEGRNFVIRSMANRNIQLPNYDWIPQTARSTRQNGHPLQQGNICANLKQLVDYVPLEPYRDLPLDSNGQIIYSGTAARVAKLSIGSFQATLYRNAKRNGQYFRPPRPVSLNVVVVREIEPPEDVKPIKWVLFTSLPTQTYNQMCYVANQYRLRWKTEPFYKLLKSGYGILKSRLNHAKKIARYLVVVTLAALTILNLKKNLGLPEDGKLSDHDYSRIKDAMLKPNDPEIAFELRLFAAIAKHGGWLGRRRDPIGHTILMRGLFDLITILDFFQNYQGFLEDSLQNRDALAKLLNVSLSRRF